MRTTILKVIGATLIASSTVQMAAAAEHDTRRDRPQATEQFRDSNAYAAPDGFLLRSPWSPSSRDEDESAMTSGIAGR